MHCIALIQYMIFTKFHISIRLEDLMTQSQLCFLFLPRASNFFWYCKAKRRESSITISASFAAVDNVSFKNRAVTIRSVAKTTKVTCGFRKQDLLGPS